MSCGQCRTPNLNRCCTKALAACCSRSHHSRADDQGKVMRAANLIFQFLPSHCFKSVARIPALNGWPRRRRFPLICIAHAFIKLTSIAAIKGAQWPNRSTVLLSDGIAKQQQPVSAICLPIFGGSRHVIGSKNAAAAALHMLRSEGQVSDHMQLACISFYHVAACFVLHSVCFTWHVQSAQLLDLSSPMFHFSTFNS